MAKQYLKALDILVNGSDEYRVVSRDDRTGTGTRGFFGYQMRFDLTKGFPLLTTKKVNFDAIVAELLWFLNGSTNIKDLDAKIWDEWAVSWETIFKKLQKDHWPSLRDDGYSKALDIIMSEDVIRMASLLGGDTKPEGWIEETISQDWIEETFSRDWIEETFSQGWIEETFSRGAPVAKVWRHPDYYEIVTKRLVEAGIFPAEKISRLEKKLGELGPVYGAMWRSWHSTEGSIDQIGELITNLKKKPYSRRHIVSGWNPAVLPDESVSPDMNALEGKQALPPCHTLFQFYVEPIPNSERKRLSCQLYQRSADVLLGVPFNIASYALLTHILAHLCDYEVGDFIHSFGDIHLYNNHIEQAKEQLSRDTRPLPSLMIDPNLKNLDDLKPEHIRLEEYNPHPPIKAPISK